MLPLICMHSFTSCSTHFFLVAPNEVCQGQHRFGGHSNENHRMSKRRTSISKRRLWSSKAGSVSNVVELLGGPVTAASIDTAHQKHVLPLICMHSFTSCSTHFFLVAPNEVCQGQHRFGGHSNENHRMSKRRTSISKRRLWSSKAGSVSNVVELPLIEQGPR